ncbi:MAG: aminotransferase class I/II-fold pyridoxal phosphate-dependent enzyme [Anaerovoracaceae bacterium]
MKKDLRITEFLLRHADSGAVSFHMPGHKGSGIYKRLGYGEFLNKIMDCDITEIPGADNLFQAEGIIKAVQDKYRELYDVSHSYLLINGTSGGIIASILAAVPVGGQLILARNCHKSVFNALTLGGIRPVYAYPDLIPEYGISGEITSEEIEKCLRENPDAAAVILPSPNYYGVCSDIAAIAEVVHRYDKVLIVDQAHGAHLKFFEKDMPLAAEEAGADITINSIHKTLASFTQSAVLNLNSDRVDRYVLEDKLQAIQSTSPSYLLMASLDINASILDFHGPTLMKEWAENLDYFYEETAKLSIPYDSSESRRCGLNFLTDLKNFDRSKINIDSSGLAMTAAQLEEALMARGIFPELTTGNILMLMTGIGNTRKDYERLLDALKQITQERLQQLETSSASASGGKDAFISGSSSSLPHSLASLPPTPKKAQLFDIPKNRKRIPLAEAEGKICASSIIPYPPGIPLVCPGEILEADTIAYVKALRDAGEKVIGVNEKGEVAVGDDK